ncbi:MAG: hypothetical protein J1E05_00505 [Eubacterium sp.]|nr:hypothetical protein [Eubacterium sp.]
MRKKSLRVAVCGLAAALSVTLMFIGGVVYIFAYTVPMLLGLISVMIKKSFGTPSAVFVYIAVSLLSLMLVPEKECVMMFVLFFGYYPIIRESFEKIKSKAIRFILKFILFNVSLTVIELICFYIFGIPFFEDGVFSAWLIIGFAAAMNLVFVMYDFLLKSFLILYEQKIEKRIKKFLK